LVNVPDWQYTVAYLRGRKVPSATEAMPRLEHLPSQATTAMIVAHAQQEAYFFEIANDSGRDIVGRNNVSELRFNLDPAGLVSEVVQFTWWRATDTSKFLRTIFTAVLTPDAL
jgi:hypothetical protein